MPPRPTENSRTRSSTPGRSTRLSDFLKDLGPGLITGAADDDPSGISTYSVAGASYGYATLWTALFSFPLMAAIQLMCARLGMVTGCGLASVIRTALFPLGAMVRLCCWWLWPTSSTSAPISGAWRDAMQMMTGVRAYFWTPFFAALILGTLALDFIPDDGAHLQVADAGPVRLCHCRILVPSQIGAMSFERRSSRMSNGARITSRCWWESWGRRSRPICSSGRRRRKSREDRDHGKTTVAQRKRRDKQRTPRGEERCDHRDVVVQSGDVLPHSHHRRHAHAHGHKNIETAKQAAEALRPLAGQGAYWLFTLGIIGTGMLAVPVLAGSCAYAIAEGARWRDASLNLQPRLAAKFYAVIAISIVVGLAFNFAGLNAVKMLFWSAILNGLLAPPLVIMVVLLTGDRKVMGKRVNSLGMKVLGWACAIVMSAAAIALVGFSR